METNEQTVLKSVEYPPPPNVHWLVLLAWWVILEIPITLFASKPFQGLLECLISNAWLFYFCNWIRALDSEARSPFWSNVLIIFDTSCMAMSMYPAGSGLYDVIGAILALASAVLIIATIYLIRDDLLKHYNEREPIGLRLNGIMTFLFSFFYFQAQLYPIAQLKRHQEEAHVEGAGGNLLG